MRVKISNAIKDDPTVSNIQIDTKFFLEYGMDYLYTEDYAHLTKWNFIVINIDKFIEYQFIYSKYIISIE